MQVQEYYYAPKIRSVKGSEEGLMIEAHPTVIFQVADARPYTPSCIHPARSPLPLSR
jgi:hypothetical protein